MASIWDRITESNKPRATFSAVLMNRNIIVDAASVDPLGASPTTTIPAGTPMAPVSGGKYKPLRMTLADGACTTDEDVIPVTDTAMFAVGDVVKKVALANPAGAQAALGTIASISAGVSITLAADTTTAVASGDIVLVAENDAMVNDTVILGEAVSTLVADGTTADTPASGVIAGQIRQGDVYMNTALGISIDRLAYLMPLMDFVPATAGTTDS